MFLLFLIIATINIVLQQRNTPYQHDEGQIFGTYYHITYQNDTSLNDDILAELKKVDDALSMFNKNSIIARINRGENAETNNMFNRVVQQMKDNMRGKEPNDAHRALAAYDIPIVTMNVDGLHQKAGSKTVIECHGNLEAGTMVLYGERAFYEQAFDLLQQATDTADKNGQRKILLVIGTSYETQFANAFVQSSAASALVSSSRLPSSDFCRQPDALCSP